MSHSGGDALHRSSHAHLSLQKWLIERIKLKALDVRKTHNAISELLQVGGQHVQHPLALEFLTGRLESFQALPCLQGTGYPR